MSIPSFSLSFRFSCVAMVLLFLASCSTPPKRTKADEVYKVEQGNEGTVVTCAGSPDCAVLGVVGAALSLAELSTKPITSTEVPGNQVLILCRIQAPENKDMSYPCGSSAVEFSPSRQPETLHFQGERIVISNLHSKTAYAVTVKLRSCAPSDANKVITNLMPGQKVGIVYPPTCLELKH